MTYKESSILIIKIIDNMKMAKSLTAIQRFNGISIKNSMPFFTEIEKYIKFHLDLL